MFSPSVVHSLDNSITDLLFLDMFEMSSVPLLSAARLLCVSMVLIARLSDLHISGLAFNVMSATNIGSWAAVSLPFLVSLNCPSFSDREPSYPLSTETEAFCSAVS